MPTFTTIFRAIVMVGVTIIAVEGWQHYGPSMAQMRTLAARALEKAHDAIVRPENSAELTAAPVEGLPVIVPQLSASPAAAAEPAPIVASTNEFPAAPAIFAPTAATELTPIQPSGAVTAPSSEERMKALMSRLEEIGGIDPQLAAWGNSGQLYRFCCRATLGSAPNIARHFESVAAEPHVAVEDVLAKVEAWRTAEQDRGRLR